jgi:hypothetical protein
MTAAECFISIQQLTQEMWEAGKDAVDDFTKAIETVSKEIYCPVDTGELKGSCRNHIVRNNKRWYFREISYNTYYAWYVHEQPTPHANPTSAQWKYLSTPLFMYQANLIRSVTDAMEGIV